MSYQQVSMQLSDYLDIAVSRGHKRYIIAVHTFEGQLPSKAFHVEANTELN